MTGERSRKIRMGELFVGLLATILIAAGILIYTFFEPQRMEAAAQAQTQADLYEAMAIYAENCAVCHGLQGNGIGAAPAINTAGLRDSDPETLTKIISRGLYETAMPAWSKEDGGPLSEYQVGQLVTLIQHGNWQETQDRVVNLGLAPRVPFAAQPDQGVLEFLAGQEGGDQLALGVRLYAENCVACHGPDGTGTALAPALNEEQVRQKGTEELRRTLLYGAPGTLMSGWDKILTDEESQALIHLVTHWDLVPLGAVPEPDTPIPVTEESLVLGAEYYAVNCSRCHGPEGQGTQRAPALNVKGYLVETSDLALQQIITQGIPATAMPAWGDRMTEADIQAVVGFIRSWEPTAPEVAEPARGGGGPWWQTEGSPPGKGRGGGPAWGNPDTGTGNSSNHNPQGNEPMQPVPASYPTSGQSGAGPGHEGGGPAWAASEAETGILWSPLDSRTRIFTGGIVGVALGLIALATFQLFRVTKH